MTFRLRLVAVAALAVAVGILATVTAGYFIVHHELYHTIDVTLSRRDQKIVAQGPSTAILRTDRSPLISVVQLLGPSGAVVASSPGQPRLPVTSQDRSVSGGHGREFYATVTVGGQPMRVLTAPLPRGGAVQLAAPLATIGHELRALAAVLGIIAAAGLAVAVALGWIVSRAVLGPLDRLIAAVEQAATTVDLSQRVEATGRDELGRLGRQFNRLLDALERSRAAQHRLVQDAAHELRTPLTSLQTNAEVMTRAEELAPGERAAVTRAVLSQLRRLATLVNDLVELAQDESSPAAAEVLRLDQVTAAAIEHARAQALAKQVSITSDLRPTQAKADRVRLQRAVANLIDNAIKWSPPGASVEVACSDNAITVRDHGPGIDPADLPYIFERFYRADTARSLPGSGLGLAIVGHAIEAEGGQVSVEQPEDGGTLMRLNLPLPGSAPRGGARRKPTKPQE